MSVEGFETDVNENRVFFVRGKGFASVLEVRVFRKNSGEFWFLKGERSSERAMIFVVYLFTLQRQ